MKKKACNCSEPDADDVETSKDKDKSKGKISNFGGKQSPPFRAKAKDTNKDENRIKKKDRIKKVK